MTEQKRLFTPGPLNTNSAVKEAMLLDLGSRDEQFTQLVSEIRDELLRVAGAAPDDGYTAIPMQGSGTFGIEAVLSTIIGSDDRLLVLSNGVYGERIRQIAAVLGLEHEVMACPETEVLSAEAVNARLRTGSFSHLAVVHCETTTGILNPIDDYARLAESHGCEYVVDAMSSFGGIPLDVASAGIHYLISSPNKCLQGVPGFSFVIARRDKLLGSSHQL